MSKKIKILVVTGPTATGKTGLAVKLAKRFEGEVISADSRQVYKYLDIGSGKDLAEYGAVPYHLIDIVPPGGAYHLKAFCADAKCAAEEIASRGRLPVICGGSALYVHAFLQNYLLPGATPDMEARKQLEQMDIDELKKLLLELDPEFYETFADRDNFIRVRRAVEIRRNPVTTPVKTLNMEVLVMGVLFPRSEVRRRIEQRLDARLNAGMIEEVRALHEQHGMSWSQLEFLGLEYRYVAEYLQEKCSFKTMRETLLNHIRQFAKRQDIFFRKMEREGVNIHWIKEGDFAEATELTTNFLAGNPIPEPKFRLKDFVNPDVKSL